jgi:hypothetical protein
MKKILFIIALLSFAVPALAVDPIDFSKPLAMIVSGRPAPGGAAAGCGGGTSYLLCENFDGSSACYSGDATYNICDGTWTAIGSPTFVFNYATSPAPLEGSYSVHLASTTETGTGYSKSFTENDTVHFFYIFNAHKRSAASLSAKILAADDTVLMTVSNAGYEWSIYCGTILGYSTTMAVDTTYYVWGDYTKGNGVNTAVCHLFHSTDTTKGSADITVTNGDAAAKKAGKFVMNQPSVVANDDYIFDKIRVSTSSIGDNPN